MGYVYAVTTRRGPGPLETPEGEGWDLVSVHSTEQSARGNLKDVEPDGQKATLHHATWKRRSSVR